MVRERASSTWACRQHSGQETVPPTGFFLHVLEAVPPSAPLEPRAPSRPAA